MNEHVVPIKSVSADEYAAMIRAGVLLLRIQSQIVAVASPLATPILIERGDPAEVIERKYREWKDRHYPVDPVDRGVR